MKLGLPDDQAVFRNALEPHRQRLGNAQPGRGNKAKEREVHQLPERTDWTRPHGRPHKAGDLIRSVDVRDPSPVGKPTRGIGRREFIASIFGAYR
jgi:hypothetical protein